MDGCEGPESLSLDKLTVDAGLFKDVNYCVSGEIYPGVSVEVVLHRFELELRSES
jgi:hypothetical protein